MKEFYVYILSTKNNKLFYIGITNNLSRRMYEHRHKLIAGFTKQYTITKLVYFEQYAIAKDAIAREKQLKNWHRKWKINLIRSANPEFIELDAETSSA